MLTITDIRTMVRTELQDANSVFFTDTELDAGIKLALEDYSRIFPRRDNEVITITTAGREQTLQTLTGLTGVYDVWWPYKTWDKKHPPNKVRGWRFFFDLVRPILYLNTADGSEPKVGDGMRVFYTCLHTISGLPAAEDVTSLPVDGEQLFVFGAAGHVANSGAIDRAEINMSALRSWGSARLTEYKQKLELFRQKDVRTEGDPWAPGWALDKWDDRAGE